VSWAVWITGIPGSGKSAIARAAAAELAAAGDAVQVLELDALRRTVTPQPAYDEAERDAVYRALVTLARVLTAAGVPVIVDATAHRRAWRDLARASIAAFAEVQLACPLAVARARERTRGPGHHPPGIYAGAGRAGATVPGVDVPYEAATAPELVIDTTRESPAQAGARVAALARSLGAPGRPHLPSVTWTVWITGRPGSGKTTVASVVGERVHRRGVPVVVLPADGLLLEIAPGSIVPRRVRDIAARAIVAAAKLLADAGRAVIVEGGALSSDLETVARGLLEDFAIVELACPPELSRTRERAVRWNLVPCPVASRPCGAPDLGLDYEAPLAPDLVVFTDVLDEATAAQQVLDLVDRLERRAQRR